MCNTYIVGHLSLILCAQHQQGSKRADLTLLKDGLDISLNTMLDDSSRMRANLTELGLALGEGRRSKIQDAIEHSAIPTHIGKQFIDQQNVLVEQRRLLEQLRQEKVQAETDQKWFTRENRQRYQGWNCNDVQTADESVPVAPGALAEAHKMLRTISSSQQAIGMQPPIEASTPQDGYLLVEFLSISGFSHRQLHDSQWEVRLSTKSHGNIATGAVDGPLNKDGTVSTRRMQVTIPFEYSRSPLDIQLNLVGEDGIASVEIPFSEVPDTRGLPQPFTLKATGAWADWEATLGIQVALCGVAPEDGNGRSLAQTRVQKHGVSGMSRSKHPGPELPTSQAFLRQRALDWQRQGCPLEVDDTSELLDRRQAGGGPQAGRGFNPVGAGVPVGRVIKRPQATPTDSEAEDGPEGGGGAFFGGYREDARDEPEPMPQPHARNGPPGNRRSRAGGDRWHSAHEFKGGSASDQWMPPHHHATTIEHSSNASRPVAAFAGFQESASSTLQADHRSSRKPAIQAFAGLKERSGVVGGIVSGLFGDRDPATRPRIQINLRPPSSLKTLQELYKELRCAVEDGLLGAADIAQDFLEFAARVAQPGVFDSQPPDEADLSMYAGILIDGIDAYPGQPVLTMWGVDALVTVFRIAGRLRSQIGVPIFAAFARACYNFVPSEELDELHARLLAGLAATVSPDCLASPKLVDYILEQLESKMAAMPVLTAEHALAVLCAIRSSHRLGTQIRHTLFLLRGFKSDPHLSTRMMVTLAELYEVMRDEILAEVCGCICSVRILPCMYAFECCIHGHP